MISVLALEFAGQQFIELFDESGLGTSHLLRRLTPRMRRCGNDNLRSILYLLGGPRKFEYNKKTRVCVRRVEHRPNRRLVAVNQT